MSSGSDHGLHPLTTPLIDTTILEEALGKASLIVANYSLLLLGKVTRVHAKWRGQRKVFAQCPLNHADCNGIQEVVLYLTKL